MISSVRWSVLTKKAFNYWHTLPTAWVSNLGVPRDKITLAPGASAGVNTNEMAHAIYLYLSNRKQALVMCW